MSSFRASAGINNPRIIADAIAEALKLEVWVPDLLEGD